MAIVHCVWQIPNICIYGTTIITGFNCSSLILAKKCHIRLYWLHSIWILSQLVCFPLYWQLSHLCHLLNFFKITFLFDHFNFPFHLLMIVYSNLCYKFLPSLSKLFYVRWSPYICSTKSNVFIIILDIFKTMSHLSCSLTISLRQFLN